MIRTKTTEAIRSYLQATYAGPVRIMAETGIEVLAPPYAVVRCGSGEAMFPGDAEIWDLNILVAVFQDADTRTAPDAELAAAEVFAALDDPTPLISAVASEIAVSAWERTGTEMSITETNWQHVAGWRCIAAPAN